MISDEELARMRRDAERLTSLRLDERGKPVHTTRWGSRSYSFRPEADVLALLDALAAERARADAAEARVRELEDGLMQELADLGQEMGVGYGPDFANPMIRPEQSKKPETGAELLEVLRRDGLVGMWADRTDIGDSAEFARRLRMMASIGPAEFARLQQAEVQGRWVAGPGEKG